MNRTMVLLAGLAVAIGIIASSQLGAQQVPAPVADEVPTGFVTVSTSTSPEVQRLREIKVRNIGGRAFIVGAPGERQLTATSPLVWIPVDVVVQMNETSPP